MATQLSEGVWWLDLQGVNAYLVCDGDALTLVDAGFPQHSRRLARDIARVGGSLAAVDRVLLTHYDIDHAGGLGRLDALDATVHVGSPDGEYLTDQRKPPWTNRKGLVQRALEVWQHRPSAPVEPVEDGGTVGSFTAYATPGHTPGHTCFVSEALSVGFLGDLVRESGGEFRPVPAALAYDAAKAEDSLRSFVGRAPAFDIACPGHGTPFLEDGDGRLADCVARLDGETV